MSTLMVIYWSGTGNTKSMAEAVAKGAAAAGAAVDLVDVFLGMPAEDVRGFMRHGGMGCHFCSYWKAYYEPEAARESA